MIYHYTTLSNLLKMWHERTDEEFEITKANNNDVDWSYYLNFHASDVRMMNDVKENRLINDVKQRASEKLLFIIDMVLNRMGALYAISFSRHKDNIPMWKEYAADDDGICLGFCADECENRIIKLHKNSICDKDDFCFGECKYLTLPTMEAESEAIVKQMEEMLNASEYEGNILPLEKEIRRIMMQSAFCKSKDFEYEQEVRLATFAPSWDSKIKEGRDGVTVYKALKVPLSLLKVIIISPLAKNKDIIQIGIDKLLFDLRHTKRYGIDIKVEYSKLEIR